MMMMVEGIKPNVGGGNGGRVVVVDDDMADGMQCTDHPYRNNPGGICAFCLQEKLGKLVSSSFPLPIRGSSSSSSSPSFRSDIAAVAGGVGPSSSSATATAAGVSLSLSVRPGSSSSLNKGRNDCRFMDQEEYYNNNSNNNNHTRRARLPFLLAKKKKKVSSNGTTSSGGDNTVVFKRSKSTTTPRRGNKFLDHHDDFISPRKHRGGFWSFLYLSSSTTTSSSSAKSATTTGSSRKIDHNNGCKTASFSSVMSAGLANTKQKERCLGSSISVVEEDNDMSSPNSQTTASASSFERKVSRSRSVGCGSRSFSGDFFERISTGFGDCTLRRVESQREGKPKSSSAAAHRGGAGGGDHHCMKERVRCGGIFGGFILTSSSSSSSSSSYWVSSSAEEMNGKPVAGGTGALAHGRNKSWGWAFASPMRAFGKPNSSNGKRDITRQASDKNSTTMPNLAAIPSLLSQ